jgi:glutamate-1-semialdehyde 2,1-aminomutase
LKREKSEAAFARAEKVIPGGVNSPVRAFGSVGGAPCFIERGKGSHIFDADGNKYIDYVCSWGPLILGHAHSEVIAAIREAAKGGTSFGAATERETLFAEALVERVPSLEKVRLVSSGTEATMTAVRLARAFTGKRLVVKFDGCYHGHADHFQVRAGSGLATGGIPSGAGILESASADTASVPFNDLEAVEKAFDSRRGEAACVIVEPVAANMGVVPPREGFLEGLRELCDGHGALLVFDEVITGFRLGRGGAQEALGVMPDLTCMGKVVGGGLPLGALGGRAEIMDRLAPLGDVYQAGTLSGNPLAVAAGLKTLEILDREDAFSRLDALGGLLEEGLRGAIAEKGAAACVARAGSLLTVFFCEGPVVDFDSAAAGSRDAFAAFFHAMLGRGIYLPPSPFEAWFLSLAHTEADVKRTVKAFAGSLES